MTTTGPYADPQGLRPRVPPKPPTSSGGSIDEPTTRAVGADSGEVTWCGHCGESLDGDHARCQRLLELEPPRYCPQCRRRMKVQVIPGGWSAECSRHGSSHHSTWG